MRDSNGDCPNVKKIKGFTFKSSFDIPSSDRIPILSKKPRERAETKNKTISHGTLHDILPCHAYNIPHSVGRSQGVFSGREGLEGLDALSSLTERNSSLI